MIEQFYWINRWILTGTTIADQNETGINGNEGVLQILQGSRTRASPSDAVQGHPQVTLSLPLVQQCILQPRLKGQKFRGAGRLSSRVGVTDQEIDDQSPKHEGIRLQHEEKKRKVRPRGSMRWRPERSDTLNDFVTLLLSVILYACTTWTQMKCLKKKIGSTQGCCRLFWTNPWSSTPQNSSCMAAYLWFHKPTK